MDLVKLSKWRSNKNAGNSINWKGEKSRNHCSFSKYSSHDLYRDEVANVTKSVGNQTTHAMIVFALHSVHNNNNNEDRIKENSNKRHTRKPKRKGKKEINVFFCSTCRCPTLRLRNWWKKRRFKCPEKKWNLLRIIICMYVCWYSIP